jgi:hypothetical protein
VLRGPRQSRGSATLPHALKLITVVTGKIVAGLSGASISNCIACIAQKSQWIFLSDAGLSDAKSARVRASITLNPGHTSAAGALS